MCRLLFARSTVCKRHVRANRSSLNPHPPRIAHRTAMMNSVVTERPKKRPGRKKPLNPIGYDCVNVLVQRAIAGVLRKAKSHDRSKKWNAANMDRIKKATAALYQKKRIQRLQETTEYRKRNKTHLMECQLRREKERRSTDTQYHTSILLRQRVRAAISRQSKGRPVKNESTLLLTGASPCEVVQRLGITSTNIGKQSGNDIDHIFPVTMYDLTDKDQQRMCFHVSNLRLMPSTQNKQKSDKLPSKEDAFLVERWCWPPGIDESEFN